MTSLITVFNTLMGHPVKLFVIITVIIVSTKLKMSSRYLSDLGSVLILFIPDSLFRNYLL